MTTNQPMSTQAPRIFLPSCNFELTNNLHYCGRVSCNTINPNTTISKSCQACPSGTRADKTSICKPCESPASFYDYLYLASILLCMFEIYQHQFPKSKRQKYGAVLNGPQFGLSCIELVFSTISSVFYYSSNFELYTCKNRENELDLSDFYTMFFDPVDPDTKSYINCTTEAVYPLYSIVLVFLANCLLWLLVLRLPAVIMFNLSTRPIVYLLKILPLTAFIFSISAGLFYFTFPYLILFFFMFYSYSKLAIMRNLMTVKVNPAKPVKLKFGISDEDAKNEILKGVRKIKEEGEEVKIQASSYGFEVKSYGKSSLYPGRNLSPKAKKKWLYPKLIVTRIWCPEAEKVLSIGDMIEPHQYLFDDLHQKDQILIYIEKSLITSFFKLWPPLIHCQIGITIGLAAIVQSLPNELKFPNLVKYSATAFIGVFVTPVCYFLLQSFGNPEVWDLNFENPKQLSEKLVEAEARKERYEDFSDDLWWKVCKPIVDKF